MKPKRRAWRGLFVARVDESVDESTDRGVAVISL
jgi:hypothetical protein